MEVKCPNCGSPSTEVDLRRNVVYCKKCNYSVHIDPTTGTVLPLNPGAEIVARKGIPAVPVIGTILLVALLFANAISPTAFVLLEALLLVFWFLWK
jgi:hypothetical protein